MIGAHEPRKNLPGAPGHAARAWIDATRYESMYRESGAEHRGVLGEAGAGPARLDQAVQPGQRHLVRRERPTRAWFADGKLNVVGGTASTAISRSAREQTAILWEADDPNDGATITLSRAARGRVPVRERAEAAWRHEGRPRHDLHADDSRDRHRDARVRAHRRDPLGGVRRLLARVARGRILDCASTVVITADQGVRGGKHIPLKANVDEALAALGTKVTRSSSCGARARKVAWMPGRDHWYDDQIDGAASTCARPTDGRRRSAIHPLTSGSTGQPKGVLHTTGGYLCSPRSRINTCSTTTTATSTGARPTSAGSRATGTSCTGRSRTARRHSCSKACRPARRGPLLAGRRQAPGQHPLHGADRDQRAMREGDGAVKRARANRCGCSARVGEPINPEAWGGITA